MDIRLFSGNSAVVSLADDNKAEEQLAGSIYQLIYI